MVSHRLRIQNLLLCHPWDDALFCAGTRAVAEELMFMYPTVEYSVSDVCEYGFTIETKEELPNLSDNFLSLVFRRTRYKSCIDVSKLVSFSDLMAYFSLIIPHRMHMPYLEQEFKRIIQKIFNKPALKHAFCTLTYGRNNSREVDARHIYFTNMSQADIAWLKMTLPTTIEQQTDIV